MPADDFLTNVETAWLTVVRQNPILAAYNWEYWDSDKQVKLPRGHVNISARPDDGTGYYKTTVEFVFEGRPKRGRFPVVMNELNALLATLELSDLNTASGDTVAFIGRAETVAMDAKIENGLRVFTLQFTQYAVPMVI